MADAMAMHEKTSIISTSDIKLDGRTHLSRSELDWNRYGRNNRNKSIFFLSNSITFRINCVISTESRDQTVKKILVRLKKRENF